MGDYSGRAIRNVNCTMMGELLNSAMDGDQIKAKTQSGTPHDKFTKALASVLSASPKQIRDSIAQAKAEKPSPHTRYSYDPEADQS